MVCQVTIAMLKGKGSLEQLDSRIGAGMQRPELTGVEMFFAHMVTRDVRVRVLKRSASPRYPH
jgi:hypothetical protein